MNRVGMVGVSVLLVSVPILGASCGDDGNADATLPPIVTTTSTSISLTTTTFIATYYKVERGDNLGNIARRLGVEMTDLMALNNITNPNEIEAGQSLLVPPPTAPSGAPPTG